MDENVEKPRSIKILEFLIGFFVVTISDFIIYSFFASLPTGSVPTIHFPIYSWRLDILILTLIQILSIIFFWRRRFYLAIGMLLGLVFVPIALLAWFFIMLWRNPYAISLLEGEQLVL